MRHTKPPNVLLLAAIINAPIDRLVTRRSLAKTLDCSTRQVTRLITAGVLPPPFRIAGRVYWRPQAIQCWLKAHSTKQGRRSKQEGLRHE